MIPQKRQISAVKSWREKSRAHLALKESKAGLHREAQSRFHDEAGDSRGRGYCMNRSWRYFKKFWCNGDKES